MLVVFLSIGNAQAQAESYMQKDNLLKTWRYSKIIENWSVAWDRLQELKTMKENLYEPEYSQAGFSGWNNPIKDRSWNNYKRICKEYSKCSRWLSRLSIEKDKRNAIDNAITDYESYYNDPIRIDVHVYAEVEHYYGEE